MSIPPDLYLALIRKKMDNRGFNKPEAEPFKVQNNPDGFEEKIVLQLAQSALELIFSTLDSVPDTLGEVPCGLKGKIPVFMLMNADDYIESMEKRLEEKEGGTNDIKIKAERKLLESLKTTKYGELDKALARANESINYLLYRTIRAARLNDPWGIIDTISCQMPMHIRPDIAKNDDGTLTNTYKLNDIQLKTLMDKNGNVMNARCIRAGSEWFNIKFGENQYMDELLYTDLSNDAKVLIKINPKDNDEITAVQTCPGAGNNFAVARKYRRQKDRTLELVSVKTFVK